MQSFLIKLIEYLGPKLIAWAIDYFIEKKKKDRDQKTIKESPKEKDREKAANDLQDMFD